MGTSSGQVIRQFFQASASHRSLSGAPAYAMLMEGMDPLPGTVGNDPDVNRWSLMGLVPRQVVTLRGNHLTLNETRYTLTSDQELFDILRNVLASAEAWGTEDIIESSWPFRGGLMGFFTYEFSRWCDPGLHQAMAKHASLQDTAYCSPLPDMVLCEFQDRILIDRHRDPNEPHTWVIHSPDKTRYEHYEKLLKSLLQQEPQHEPSVMSHGSSAQPIRRELTESDLDGYTMSLDEKAFSDAVDELKTAIESGEFYQANLTMKLSKRLRLNPYQVYDQLSIRNPSPFSALFQWPGGMLLSNSPERLVKMDAHGRIAVRPIAGTRGRGQTDEEDEQIARALRADEKERAEHLMLVDLARNDLGRICRAGTVHVDDLLMIERYSHVTHLVSSVSGEIGAGYDSWDVLKATFPGGTITGCPKIRCVERLNKLESLPRGLYTGSLGYLDVQGGMDLNILIRTLVLEETETPFVYNGAVQVGAGIVADSVGAYEYRECLRKAAAILGVLKDCEHASNESSSESGFTVESAIPT